MSLVKAACSASASYSSSAIWDPALTNAEIYISVNTPKTHVKAIYRKLGVSTRRDALIEGRRLGLA